MKSEQIIGIIQRELDCGNAGIELSTKLTELPMDSLEFVEIIHCIEKEIGPIPKIALRQAETIGDLARAIT